MVIRKGRSKTGMNGAVGCHGPADRQNTDKKKIIFILDQFKIRKQYRLRLKLEFISKVKITIFGIEII